MFFGLRKFYLSLSAVLIVSTGLSFSANGSDGTVGEAQCSDQSGPAIATILETLERVKENRDYEDLPDFWDQSDAAPFYIAEEIPQVMTDWPSIKAYWEGTKATSGWIDVEYDLISHKCLGAKDVLVLFDLRWDMSVDGFDRPIGGSNRVIAGLRDVDGDWKFHTWVEAPLAALIYMQKLYEKNVRSEVLDKRAETE